MASRMQLGRSICRYVSARALSATPVASFTRGRIPLGARCYCSSVPPSDGGFLYPVLPHLKFFSVVFVLVTSKLCYEEYWRDAEKITADTGEMRKKAKELKAELEQERVERESLEKLLAQRCGTGRV